MTHKYKEITKNVDEYLLTSVDNVDEYLLT